MTTLAEVHKGRYRESSRYLVSFASTQSRYYLSQRWVTASDLAEAEGRATRELRALALTSFYGDVWDRWTIAVHGLHNGLPRIVAHGDRDGTIHCPCGHGREEVPGGTA